MCMPKFIDIGPSGPVNHHNHPLTCHVELFGYQNRCNGLKVLDTGDQLQKATWSPKLLLLLYIKHLTFSYNYSQCCLFHLYVIYHNDKEAKSRKDTISVIDKIVLDLIEMRRLCPSCSEKKKVTISINRVKRMQNSNESRNESQN